MMETQVIEKRNLRKWFVAKSNPHNAQGIEKPENWLWERIDGVFQPIEEIKQYEPTAEENETHRTS